MNIPDASFNAPLHVPIPNYPASEHLTARQKGTCRAVVAGLQEVTPAMNAMADHSVWRARLPAKYRSTWRGALRMLLARRVPCRGGGGGGGGALKPARSGGGVPLAKTCSALFLQKHIHQLRDGPPAKSC